MKTNYPEIIRRYYPAAMEHKSLINRVKLYIETELRINPNQVMSANSICSDDINAMQFPNLGKDLLGPFNLGGLGGEPFAGLTGMNAFAHHKTENGALLIFFAPHIGISKYGEPNGKPGFVLRKGQKEASECCGALIEGIRRIEKLRNPPPPPEAPDYQEEVLTHTLYNRKAYILDPKNNKYIAATKVTYDAIRKNVYDLVKRAIKAKSINPALHILMVGGVIINVDEGSEAFFSLDRFERYIPQTREKVNHLQHFNDWLIKK